MPVGDPALPQRFWDKVAVDERTGCWKREARRAAA